MTWLEETVNAFEKIGGEGHVQDIYKYILNHTDRVLKRTWKASVRKSIELNSSNSKAYEGKNDLFESVNGINNGIWRLRKDEIVTPYAADRIDLDEQAPEKILSAIYRYQRDTKMIRTLKILYQDCCQVCGLVIKIKNQNYSEGHHLRPLGKNHKGPDLASNILILCPNHHVEFDYGMIGIDYDLKISHTDPTNSVNGNQVVLKHTLDTKFLKYHWDNVFKIAPNSSTIQSE